MKKLSLILALILVGTFLFGCNNTGDSESSMDKALVGAWQLEDESQTEYYIFTEDSKVRIAKGSVYFEGDATFVSYADGSHKYFSDFYYMAGELSYTVNDNTVTFDDGEGTKQTLIKAEYSPVELQPYENFNTQNPLVGTWYNEEYNDTFIFAADGTASYSMENTDLSYTSHIDYTYTEKDGKVYFTYDAGSGSREMINTYEITGDTLNIEGSGEYTRQ